jgi:hypothetical protein
MSQTAHVRSIEAVERVHVALTQFGDEAQQALDEVRMELDRFVEWLSHDQTEYWKGEVRRCEAKLAEAKVDLHRARSATIDPEHTPSCLQEQKVLDTAKRRLESTEEKLKRVRGWIPIVQQAVQDYQTQTAPLVNGLTYELPRAITFVRQLVSRLEDYAALAPPSTGRTPAVLGAPSMALPDTVAVDASQSNASEVSES